MITPRIKPSGFFPEEAPDNMELVHQRKAKLEGYVQTLAAMDELIDFSEMAGAGDGQASQVSLWKKGTPQAMTAPGRESLFDVITERLLLREESRECRNTRHGL